MPQPARPRRSVQRPAPLARRAVMAPSARRLAAAARRRSASSDA